MGVSNYFYCFIFIHQLELKKFRRDREVEERGKGQRDNYIKVYPIVDDIV